LTGNHGDHLTIPRTPVLARRYGLAHGAEEGSARDDIRKESGAETGGVSHGCQSMTTPVSDNPAKSRFELDVGGQVVFARYARHGSTLVIPYVEAPPALRGTGAAGRLMEGVMEIVRAKGLKVRPLCGYASSWIRRHKQHHDLLG
jgi:uncharacterized protein